MRIVTSYNQRKPAMKVSVTYTLNASCSVELLSNNKRSERPEIGDLAGVRYHGHQKQRPLDLNGEERYFCLTLRIADQSLPLPGMSCLTKPDLQQADIALRQPTLKRGEIFLLV